MTLGLLKQFRQATKAEPGTWLFLTAVVLMVFAFAAMFVAAMVS